MKKRIVARRRDEGEELGGGVKERSIDRRRGGGEEYS